MATTSMNSTPVRMGSKADLVPRFQPIKIHECSDDEDGASPNITDQGPASPLPTPVSLDQQQQQEQQQQQQEQEQNHEVAERKSSLEDGSVATPEKREEITQRLTRLLDFYFGEENYSKDQFLRKQASLDLSGESWIAIEVVAAFKRVKKLTSDMDLVLAAVRASENATLNADATKIRRKQVLDKDIEGALTRTVLLANLAESVTEETVREVCAAHGPIYRVRFHAWAKDPLPEDIAKYCTDEHGQVRMPQQQTWRPRPEMRCAFIEYGHPKQAHAAARALHSDKDWRSNLYACVLHRKQKAPNALSASPFPASGAPSNAASRAASPSPAALLAATSTAIFVSRTRPTSRAGAASPGPSDAQALAIPTAAAPASTAATPARSGVSPIPFSTSPAQLAAPGSAPASGRLSAGPTRLRSAYSPSTSGASPVHVAAPSPSPAGSSSPWVPRGKVIGKPIVMQTSSRPVQQVVRQPTGPDGTRGFAKRK